MLGYRYTCTVVHMSTSRRTTAQRKSDREAIMALLDPANRSRITAMEAMGLTGNALAASDLEALAKAGRLFRRVEVRYDRQTGYAANLFGGAGCMKRRVAAYWLPEVAERIGLAEAPADI